MSRFLIACDIIGPEPKINTFNKSRYQTVFGGVLSIISYIAIVAIGLYIIIQSITGKVFSIIYNEDRNSNTTYNYTKNPMMFGIVSQDSPYIVPNSLQEIYTVEVERYTVNADVFPPNVTRSILNTIPCAILLNSFPNKEIFNENVMIGGYCIDPSTADFMLYGSQGTIQSFSMLSIRFYECVNSANKICKPKSYIDRFLKKTYMGLYSPDYIIDHQNTSSVAQIYGNGLLFEVSNTINSIYNVFFVNVDYESDYGFIFSDWNQENFTKFDRYESIVNNNKDKNIFGEIKILTDRKFMKFSRTFLKLQSLIADVGGTVDLILLLAKFVENFIIENYYLSKMAYVIFNNNFDVNEEKIQKTKINNFLSKDGFKSSHKNKDDIKNNRYS